MLNRVLVCILFSMNILADERSVQVIGECNLQTDPDQYIVSMHISKLLKTPEESLNAANEIFNKLKKEVENEKSHIKLTSFRSYEHKEWEKEKNVSKGFNTTISFNIETDSYKKLSHMISKATKFNIEAVDQVSTSLSESKSKSLEIECLSLAVENAKKKAETMASKLGAGLGKVSRIIESGTDSNPMPLMARSEMMMKTSGDAVVSPELPESKVEFKKKVSVFFILE